MINDLLILLKNVSVLWFWVKSRSWSVPEFSWPDLWVLLSLSAGL